MKPGATPELSKKWWEANKAKTLLKTGVGDALQKFEIAIQKKDDALVLKSISELKSTIAAAIKKADKKHHAETISALEKYPKLLDKQEELAKDRIERAKQPAVPPQKFGRPDVIWEVDVSKLVTDKIDPTWLASFSGCKLRLAVDDQLVATIRGNGEAAVLQFMVTDAQKIGDAVVKALEARVKQLDDNKGKTPQQMDKVRGDLKSDVEKIMKMAETKLKAIPDERWKLFVSRKKQYRDYKVKAGVEVAVGAVGITASAAGIVGTGGAGLALGIVGLTRSAAVLIKQVYDLCLEADKVGTNLEKSCGKLKTRYESAKRQAGNEVSATVIRGLLGTNPFLDSLPEAEDSLKLWDNKIAGVSGALQEASDKITDAIDKAGELEKKIKNAQGKDARQIHEKITKVQAALGKMLDKAFDLGGSITRFEETGPKIDKLLIQLRANNSDYVEIFEKAFPIVVQAGLAGANAADGFKSAKEALDYAKTSVDLANEIRDMKDQLIEAIG